MLCVGSGVRHATASQPQARPPQANRHQRPPQHHSSPQLPPPRHRRRLPRAPTTAIAMQRVRLALPPFESANRAIAKVSTEMATAPRATTNQKGMPRIPFQLQVRHFTPRTTADADGGRAGQCGAVRRERRPVERGVAGSAMTEGVPAAAVTHAGNVADEDLALPNSG